MIKPGCLCWIVQSYNPKWIGRVVTAVSSVGNRQWLIEAEWLPSMGLGDYWVSLESSLRPISDPDADLTEQTDALTDSMLDVLAQAHQPETA